jgi:hypothetical protein
MDKNELDFGKLISDKIEAFAKEYSLVGLLNRRNYKKATEILTQRRSKEKVGDIKYLLTSKRISSDDYQGIEAIAFEDKEGAVVKGICDNATNVIPEEMKLFHIALYGCNNRYTCYQWGGAFSGAKLRGLKTYGEIKIPLDTAADLLSLLGVFLI